MKVTLDTSQLLKALDRAHRVIDRNCSIAILSNVLVRAGDNALSITATDMDIEVAETLPAMIHQPGATTIPAQLLYEIVRKAGSQSETTLSLTEDATRIEFCAGGARFSLCCIPEHDFPDFQSQSFGVHFKMAAGQLKTMIERTLFAASTDENRYYLHGAHLHVSDEADGSLCMVATDGRRLARIAVPMPEGSENLPPVTIPAKALREVSRLLDDPESIVRIEACDRQLRFSVGRSVFRTKIIDAPFPEYKRVIPTGNEIRLSADCRRLIQVADRLATVAPVSDRPLRLLMNRNSLVVSARNLEVGTATEEMPAAFEGRPFEIGFNAGYLLDIAHQITGEEMLFSFSDKGAPTLIRDTGDDSVLYVLMPMRI